MLQNNQEPSWRESHLEWCVRDNITWIIPCHYWCFRYDLFIFGSIYLIITYYRCWKDNSIKLLIRKRDFLKPEKSWENLNQWLGQRQIERIFSFKCLRITRWYSFLDNDCKRMPWICRKTQAQRNLSREDEQSRRNYLRT